MATGRNLERFREVVFERLNIMRVFSKSPGKAADHTAPFVLKIGETVMDFAAKVHFDFSQKLKTARIWGHGVPDGQMAPRDHVLHDG
ncbi:MAG: TGS domain-containing protein, partial [Proteobacteria bacterium]|nr:TGS domain-containing protein [Pseudomonadota bacterium]